MLDISLIYVSALTSVSVLGGLTFRRMNGIDMWMMFVVTVTSTVALLNTLIVALGDYVAALKDPWSDLYLRMTLKLEQLLDTQLVRNQVMVILIITVLSTAVIARRLFYALVPAVQIPSRCFQPEKMVSGSEFEMNVPVPKFQCEVHVSMDGKRWVLNGQAFWVRDCLLTAAHVMQDYTYVKLVKGGAVSHVTNWTLLDGDIAMIPMRPEEASRLSLSKAKLISISPGSKSGLLVQVSALGKRSCGFLKTFEQFGFCEYQGSTIKGFSGAPYFMNNQVYGMHLGGAVSNLGYEAAFLDALLVNEEKVYDPEDSGEFIMDQISRDEDWQYERNPYTPDEYKVKANGKYYFLDEDQMDEVRQRFGKRGREVTIRTDFEQESAEPVTVDETVPAAPRAALNFQDQGNLIRAPTASVGARGQVKDQGSAQAPGLRVLKTPASEYQTSSESCPMGSPSLTPVQLNGPSASTRKGKRARTNRQRRLKELEQLRALLNTTPDGRQILQQLQTPNNGLIASLQELSMRSTMTALPDTANLQPLGQRTERY